jgi:hypothetical protein
VRGPVRRVHLGIGAPAPDDAVAASVREFAAASFIRSKPLAFRPSETTPVGPAVRPERYERRRRRSHRAPPAATIAMAVRAVMTAPAMTDAGR